MEIHVDECNLMMELSLTLILTINVPFTKKYCWVNSEKLNQISAFV